MKILVIIISMLTLLSMNGYSQKNDVKKLLDNQETRTSIFNTIAGSHEFMTEFMNVAMNNEHAMMMMNNNNMEHQHQMGMNHNQGGMQGNHQMMENGNKMGMMNNPEMMQNMMENMMNVCNRDSTLRSEMTEIISDHPKMMEMMKDHGMTDMHSLCTSGTMGQMHTMNNSNHKRYQHK